MMSGYWKKIRQSITKTGFVLCLLSSVGYAITPVNVEIQANVPVMCGLDNVPTTFNFPSFTTKANNRGAKIGNVHFGVYCNAEPTYKITATHGYLKHQTYDEMLDGILPHYFTDKMPYTVSLKVGSNQVIPLQSIANNPSTGISVSSSLVPYTTQAELRVRISASSLKYRISGTYHDEITVTITGL